MNDRDCSTIFALLSQYLDRELPPSECEEFERHIQTCAPCVEFIDNLKKSIALGRGYSPHIEAPPPSPELKQSLQALYERMLTERAGKSPEPPLNRRDED